MKGAYTGADRDRVGRFEAAHGGTIFLDEIGDIPLSTQVKLLRVLEEKEIERVGDHRAIPVDVRIVSATNKNLEKLISSDDFREDLFFRINVFPLQCPSLIPGIVQNFIEQNSAKSGKKILGLTPEAMEVLLAHDWPGNVRELRNAIEYAFVLCSGGWIESHHMPPKLALNHVQHVQGDETCRLAPERQAEKDRLIKTLKKTNGNQSETARLIGVSRVTIWKRIKKYCIRLKEEL